MGFLVLLVKNRHHSALFVQNGYLKLLIRQSPMSNNVDAMYASEWMWKLPQINDDQWHSYKLVVDYPNRVRDYFLVVQITLSIRIVFIG